jgi:hypothetical protein
MGDIASRVDSDRSDGRSKEADHVNRELTAAEFLALMRSHEKAGPAWRADPKDLVRVGDAWVSRETADAIAKELAA